MNNAPGGSPVNPCDYCGGYGAYTNHNGLRITCRNCNGTGLHLPRWPRSQGEWSEQVAWWGHIKELERKLDAENA